MKVDRKGVKNEMIVLLFDKSESGKKVRGNDILFNDINTLICKI